MPELRWMPDWKTDLPGAMRLTPAAWQRPLAGPSASAGLQLSQLADRLRQSKVTAGDAAGIMGDKSNADPVVNIGPLRMVIGAFCQQRNLAHKAERGNKIRKDKFPLQLAGLDAPGAGTVAVELLQLVFKHLLCIFAIHDCLRVFHLLLHVTFLV